MKVMLVNDCPVGAGASGGVEEHVQSLSALLGESGHSAITVTGQARGESAFRSPTHHRIPGLGAPPVRKRIVRHLRLQHNALATLRDLVVSEQPDVIHIHNLCNPAALRTLRSLGPTVKSIHDCRPFCAKPRPGVATRLIGNSDVLCSRPFSRHCWGACYAHAGTTMKERLEAWSYFPNNFRVLREVMRCDGLIVPSKYIGELAVANGVEQDALDLLHYFCDPACVPAAKADKDSEAPVLFFAGRHVHEKGVMHLLDALECMPAGGFKAVIAGTGPLHEEVATRVAEMRPRVDIELPGYVERAALLAYYASSACVVFPSIGSEGCPLTGIEAMHCGTPVVAFDTGGVSEWLVHGLTGLLVPRGDTQQLAAAMTRMVESPSWCQRLGRSALEFIRSEFSAELHLEGLLASYRKSIARYAERPVPDSMSACEPRQTSREHLQ